MLFKLECYINFAGETDYPHTGSVHPNLTQKIFQMTEFFMFFPPYQLTPPLTTTSGAANTPFGGSPFRSKTIRGLLPALSFGNRGAASAQVLS